MSDGSSWVEIVLLAMLAAFIGLRLVSVLGKRTGQERPIGDSSPRAVPEVVPAVTRDASRAPRSIAALPAGTDAALAPALQAVANVDANFEPQRFVDGAKAAYAVILEAFWAGDTGAMEGLVSDEVQENFDSAIQARDGSKLKNRLIGLDAAAITAAELVGQMAEVTVRFVARVTMAGAAPMLTTDIWTFSRHVTSRDPAWLLIATDDEPGPDALPA
ncbi:Tim44/TimA family putative adaptor protein [Sandarakinorhabdus sp.]|uniref:Tim44/TimA family putative adaptor protein n=1 Tax=Sandarakinorhabdus sp. TaxID=1916663 RepID=UPI00286E3548|nr:Tim44/TimA family putative adaptor protein [Sandarakinorhabdus sp.]